MEESAQADERVDFTNYRFRVKFLVIGRKQTVAMRHENLFVVNGGDVRMMMNRHARKPAKSAKRPDVVVACEEMYLNAFVNQMTDGVHEIGILRLGFVGYIVFEPKVEHVAKKVNGVCVLAHLTEKFADFHLVGITAFDGF